MDLTNVVKTWRQSSDKQWSFQVIDQFKYRWVAKLKRNIICASYFLKFFRLLAKIALFPVMNDAARYQHDVFGLQTIVRTLCAVMT